MGQKHEYDCPRCGYSAFVGGGLDLGFEAAFVTIHCLDCKELIDVELDRPASEVMAASRDDEGEDLPLAELDDVKGVRCPRGSGHRFELWDAGGACPKCGTTLVPGLEGPCWD